MRISFYFIRDCVQDDWKLQVYIYRLSDTQTKYADNATETLYN